jgi:hypothetical protein
MMAACTDRAPPPVFPDPPPPVLAEPIGGVVEHRELGATERDAAAPAEPSPEAVAPPGSAAPGSASPGGAAPGSASPGATPTMDAPP